MDIKDFGAYLRRKRQARNISLNELARRAKVDAANLSRLERGERSNPSAEMLAKIADGLNMSREEMFEAAGYLKPGEEKVVDIKDLLETEKAAHWDGVPLNEEQRKYFADLLDTIMKRELKKALSKDKDEPHAR